MYPVIALQAPVPVNDLLDLQSVRIMKQRVLWLAVRMVDYANRNEAGGIKVGWSSGLGRVDGLNDDRPWLVNR